MSNNIPLDPKLDLNFERDVDVSPEAIYKAWTTPELLKQWFTPSPWKTIEAELDVRPGGIFRTTMLSPEGKEFPNYGSFLEAIPNKRLVFTNLMGPGFRPLAVDNNGFAFTGIITLAPGGNGTKYRATVLHADEAGAKKHAAMGFEQGWSKALDQMVALIKKI